LALADRYKDDFFEDSTNWTEYKKGYLKGQLDALQEVSGIGYIVKHYKSNK
jgi:hypothetical protein